MLLSRSQGNKASFFKPTMSWLFNMKEEKQKHNSNEFIVYIMSDKWYVEVAEILLRCTVRCTNSHWTRQGEVYSVAALSP